jgi:hypothetical protein
VEREGPSDEVEREAFGMICGSGGHFQRMKKE